MASPQLAIARVSFSAVLLRPDPTSCPRGEIDEFLQLLDATISRCSSPNVQKTKQWILKNLVQSPARVVALGKYLTALSKSFSLDVAASRQAREPSAKRKRLHILYVLSDVLYHVNVRIGDSSFAQKLEPYLPDLVRAAAAFPNSPKQSKKVLGLVDFWSENGFFPQAFTQKLTTIIHEAPNSIPKSDAPIDAATATASKSAKDAPFIMPAMHGDVAVSWYDLPAANWLPVIEPNSTRPMNPDMIKPLRFVAGPADKTLVKAVQDLLADVDRIYNKDQRDVDRSAQDMDQLGQRIVLDEITGEVIDGETYYGWSRAFCEKMKQRRKKATDRRNDSRGRGLSRSRSRSRSTSRSLSQPAFKRRRVSGSRSPSQSRSRSRSRRRNHSGERHKRRSYSGSNSRSRSRDPRYNRSLSPSRGRSPPPPPRPYDGPPFAGSNGNHHPMFQNQPPHPNAPYQHPNVPPFPQSFPPMPPDFNQFIVPPPPPPPPHYQGHPPHPPPMPPVGNMPPNMPPNWLQSMAMAGWPAQPPPPPPPPPQHPPHQGGGSYQQYGRGGRGNYRGAGHRGGWEHRGRGGW
ncbi:uncharacterized protein GGS25DRAFT_490728 [Hypoxylon fragiforme]|uniref:uncharacterized protein n=1 Tax=Hypoxylon fragiforme TaxID=63214 RepID=UPI0020C6FA1B|nr:uncharacterized protein GGS25DRAFT_490728 [Hypoxylon fragiforme]KAI2608535.1 hypothetical protein GGS25DRAFT_490728 [Hypoxylon fragiforme]